MPESSTRKPKATEAPRPAVLSDSEEGENPTWYKATMFGFMIAGLIWILTYYISSARFPLGSAAFIDLGNWNILIGFGIAMVGFVMTTKWK
jgi:hypothetical protein